MSLQDVVRGRRAAMAEIYRIARDEIAMMTLFDLYYSTTELYPTATAVGLNVTDQDTSGGHWAGVVIDHDGNVIEEEPEFDDLTLLDLDDSTMHVWGPFIDQAAVGPDDTYLELDAIRHALVERWGSDALAPDEPSQEDQAREERRLMDLELDRRDKVMTPEDRTY